MKYVIAIFCLFFIVGCSDDTPSTATAVETETSVPEPVKRTNREKFAMGVKDFFVIGGDQIVVTGQIASGTVATGDTICISSSTGNNVQAEVTGMEKSSKVIQQASAGENVGIMLGGIDKDQVGKGYQLSSCQ